MGADLSFFRRSWTIAFAHQCDWTLRIASARASIREEKLAQSPSEQVQEHMRYYANFVHQRGKQLQGHSKNGAG